VGVVSGVRASDTHAPIPYTYVVSRGNLALTDSPSRCTGRTIPLVINTVSTPLTTFENYVSGGNGLQVQRESGTRYSRSNRSNANRPEGACSIA
jgi:hypothetical protein